MSGPSRRLLFLLSLLQVRRDWPGHQLADRLEISARTVRRDVDRLRELGYPIRALKGPDGGYRLEAGADLPPLLFDDDQAVALSVALQLASTSTTGVGEAAARALATVRQVMPPRLRQRVDAVAVTPLDRHDDGVDLTVIASLSDAIRTTEIVRFTYKNQQRRAEPHHLVVRYGRWYLLAWDLDRDDWRTFRVDRMDLQNTVGHRFTPREIPGGNVTMFVGGLFKGGDERNTWPCVGSVTLAMPADAIAPYVADGDLEAIDESHCRVTQGAWTWTALAASFGRADADISDVEPAELRHAFTTLATRFMATSTTHGAT